MSLELREELGLKGCFKEDLNNGKDDKSIAGDSGDAEGVEDQREPEPREARRWFGFHHFSSKVPFHVHFTLFVLSCTDYLSSHDLVIHLVLLWAPKNYSGADFASIICPQNGPCVLFPLRKLLWHIFWFNDLSWQVLVCLSANTHKFSQVDIKGQVRMGKELTFSETSQHSDCQTLNVKIILTS